MSAWRSRSFLLLLLLLVRCSLVVIHSATATTVESEALVEPVSCTLFICAVDGSVYSLDALTGMAKGYFGTGRPLVAASSPNVVPGLDGHIYMLSDEDVQVLPMTVYQVVQHPVRTCHSDDSKQCGIVTGTKLTYLYALDPITGRLEWTQQYGKMEDTNESSDAVVVLQRQDYVVRHISALTGEEVWNVTLGHVSALDFSSPTPKDMLPGHVEQEDASEKLALDDTMPEIAFGTDGMTITAMDSNHQVLWKRRLNTLIASVYGSVGSKWVPLTVLETPNEQLVENDDDASNSMTTPLLLPAPPDRPQERNMYLELLWQEIQNMATASVGMSDMVIYQPPPRWDRASAELNRLVGHKATSSSRAQQTCTGGTIHGVCQDGFLLGSETNNNNKDFPPPPPPQPIGLFLSWNTVVEGMVVLVLLMGIGLRFLYRRKKRQWMAEQRKALFQERIENIRNDMVLSTHSDKSIIPRSVRSKRSVSLPVELHRSVSLPVLHHHPPAPVIREPPLPNILHLGNKLELVRTSTAPTVTDTSGGDRTGNMDGIPLVRYSRYKSEFREIAPLGRGGFGTVFRCENALDGREYAIKKVWIPSGEEFSQRLQRVLREVKILALLDHPNIVRYYTAWLELEDDNDRGDKNRAEESTTMNGCFSSELPTTGLTASDGRRPFPRSKKGRTLYKSSNPLGWNGIDLAAELNDELVDDGEHGDFGSSDSLNGRRPTFRRSNRVLPAIHDNSGDESFSESYNGSSFSDDASQSSFSSRGRDPRTSSNGRLSPIGKTRDKMTETKLPSEQGAKKKEMRHMLLYIQMQLCSQKTLGDFLANPQARKGTADKDAVDIPLALGLFHQIAQGVKHVHEQGLIHRDLKPCNCFIDDAGVVKVGDFGLSRESGDIGENSNLSILGDRDDDNTAGVGTRSYASPEQMKGSDYGASTDVYSLGIMLFELCYPMSTGMERNIVFSQLRQLHFPDTWQTGVARSFPSVHSLLKAMLSPRSSDRPSAETVASQVESLLGEYTVLSLDRKRHDKDGSTLLRVEADSDEGILPQTIQRIKDAAPNVEIAEYGLRGQNSEAIMEFALRNDTQVSLERILEKLKSASNIHVVRQISDTVSMKF